MLAQLNKHINCFNGGFGVGRGVWGFMGVGMLEYHKKSICGAPWGIDFRWKIGANIDGKWGVTSHLKIYLFTILFAYKIDDHVAVELNCEH